MWHPSDSVNRCCNGFFEASQTRIAQLNASKQRATTGPEAQVGQ